MRASSAISVLRGLGYSNVRLMHFYSFVSDLIVIALNLLLVFLNNVQLYNGGGVSDMQNVVDDN